MNTASKAILTAGAAALLASFVAPNPALAETTGKPVRCLQQQVDRHDVAWPSGKQFHTDQLTVAAGSPCKDINARGVLDVDKKPTCRTLRVVYGTAGKKGRWHRTCKGWTVLWRGAREGDTFTIELKGRPSTVQVRS